LTFRRASREQQERWKAALQWFVQKLTYEHGPRPLVLKSPAHTGRVKLLLEAFPDARFVHIHRHPYEVYQSAVHTTKKVIPWWTLQRPDHEGVEERTLAEYAEVYEAYFEERHLIPAGRLHELRYADLVADPIGQLRTTYEALGLPDFSVAEPNVREYLGTIRDYQRNQFTDIEPSRKEAVRARWRPCFEEWGYEA
jgi:hypothetical protein